MFELLTDSNYTSIELHNKELMSCSYIINLIISVVPIKTSWKYPRWSLFSETYPNPNVFEGNS